MLVDATSGAIAQTIISLGRAMGLPVIAEGVETEEQRDFLAGLGCLRFRVTCSAGRFLWRNSNCCWKSLAEIWSGFPVWHRGAEQGRG
jgi:hypothetical protein